MHALRPQCYETWNQPKEKVWKTSKSMEVKEHPTKEWMGVNQAIKEEIKKYMETNENENTTIQILWDSAKAVLRRKCIAIKVYLKKQEKSQIQNLISQLKELQAEQQRNSKARRRIEIINITAEINSI